MYSYIISLILVSLVLAAAVDPPYTHHALLDNVQANSDSAAWGAAIVSFSRVTGMLACTIVNNVNGTFAAHIHGPGAPLGTYGIIVAIPGFENGSNHAVSVTVKIPTANYDDIDQGRTYFNIHTNKWPNGEIRGQILAIGQQITGLTGAQDDVTTSAVGVAVTRFDASNNNLSLVLNHTVTNATLAHIHGPAAPGSQGPPILTLAGNSAAAAAVPYYFYAILTSDQVAYLKAGLLYYNIHSVAFPGGEIRGQINPFVNYLAELNGAQDSQVTTAKGVGLAALYGNALWTSVYHTAENVTQAHIHTGIPGVAGPVAFPYANASTNPISQNFTATQDQVTLFTNGTDYFNVHTTSAPGGLIRGQIYAKQATPSTTTTTSTSGGVTTSSNQTTTTHTATGSTSTSTSGASSVAVSVLALLSFCLFVMA